MESSNKSVTRDSYQNHVSKLESLKEQMPVTGVQDVEGPSKSYKFVSAL